MPATKKSKSNDGKAILTSTTIDDLTALTTAQLYALSSRRHRDESREVSLGKCALPLDMVYHIFYHHRKIYHTKIACNSLFAHPTQCYTFLRPSDVHKRNVTVHMSRWNRHRDG